MCGIERMGYFYRAVQDSQNDELGGRKQILSGERFHWQYTSFSDILCVSGLSALNRLLPHTPYSFEV